MKEIMSTIFEYSISSLEISKDPIINYIVMLIVGLIAFKVSFALVGEIGARGALGSFLHWTIRIVIFIVIWAAIITIINIVKFVISVPIWYWLALFLLLLLYLIMIVARNNPKSILNKKII